jgi:hypothetical protein
MMRLKEIRVWRERLASPDVPSASVALGRMAETVQRPFARPCVPSDPYLGVGRGFDEVGSVSPTHSTLEQVVAVCHFRVGPSIVWPSLGQVWGQVSGFVSSASDRRIRLRLCRKRRFSRDSPFPLASPTPPEKDGSSQMERAEPRCNRCEDREGLSAVLAPSGLRVHRPSRTRRPAAIARMFMKVPLWSM